MSHLLAFPQSDRRADIYPRMYHSRYGVIPPQQRIFLPEPPTSLQSLGIMPALPDLVSVKAEASKSMPHRHFYCSCELIVLSWAALRTIIVKDAEKIVYSPPDTAPPGSITLTSSRAVLGNAMPHDSVAQSAVSLFTLLPTLFKYSFLIHTDDGTFSICGKLLPALT